MEHLLHKTQRSLWLLTISFVLSLGCLVYPLLVLLPSRPQGAGELAVALAMLRVRPFVEILCLIVALLALAGYCRSHVSGWRRVHGGGVAGRHICRAIAHQRV